MHGRRRFRFAAALACTPWLPSVVGFAADPLPEPIVTRDRQFAIPFQLDAADASQAEARLYCSDDAGKNWKLASRAKAPLEAFDFQAAADNEYWFAVRTADMAGRESSTEAPTAEMRVIVDTLPTKLDVKAERTAEGPIVVRWQIDDAHIAPDTLKFSVRADGGSAQEIEPLRSKRRLDRRSASGEMQWVPKPGSKDLMLIAEVRDAADNPTTIEVPLAAAASSAPLATAPQPARLPELAPVATAPAAAPPAGPVASLRDPTKPMLVNSPSFELDYDIEHLGNTPIAKVDIWGTRDRGRNWVLLGPDDDRRSPCAVNVEREGMYGFAVVVTAEGGVQGRIPQPGDVPEINVGVDLSKPKVRFTTAEPSTDGRPCAMQIKWDAADDHLGPQAVTLSYSAAPQGPWKPLAIGIGSSGVHLCEFDPQGPDYAYLKIEVRDEAGNIGSHTTTNAIPIEKRRMQVTFAGATKPEGQSQGPKWFHVLQ